ncbi:MULTISPECIES: lysophospholipid acyltransferase family protein [Shouchella]|uniref:Phospholipid/glycerol acyltransferase n=2 Tax=Bacillaceae TaxID=186817 RepID=A0A060LXX9_9BACI|nr:MULTISPECIES: lysophospholipid acyltransferase family protein [Bacillaceae]AIC94625.1 phospholipid/glycerol acyltransferase [Shouchella lehensis G1]KQL51818.1 acyl-phosphate glycerol 3-phosphate acyltransferase [Alkalicoccobacillus plakortidis]RQW20492.1 1-acyl-sn-glycerol-3-phosphate acyltransferase [Bacillus sp. C1-1]
MKLYRFGQAVCRLVLRTLFKVEIRGKEHIPSEGGVLLCSNHISNFDPPLLGAFIHRQVRYMAKKELFDKKGIGKLLKGLGAFPVKRGGSDRESLRTALRILKEGDMVGLFPEGTRSKTGEIGNGLAGAGFFAGKSEAYVIPCVIIGPYRFRKRVILAYGEPIDMEAYRQQRVSAQEITDTIMTEIQRLKDIHQ